MPTHKKTQSLLPILKNKSSVKLPQIESPSNSDIFAINYEYDIRRSMKNPLYGINKLLLVNRVEKPQVQPHVHDRYRLEKHKAILTPAQREAKREKNR
jgi:hypothetical protein